MSERLDGQRLRRPRNALNESMPLRQDGDQYLLYNIVLPNDRLAEFIETVGNCRRCVL